MSKQSAVFNFATKHAMPPEFRGKWRTECLNTRFPLPILLCGIQCEADLILINNRTKQITRSNLAGNSYNWSATVTSVGMLKRNNAGRSHPT